MKTKHTPILAFLILSAFASSFLSAAAGPMAPAYWEQWNPAEQARIDRDIEQNRKADAVLQLKNVAKNAEVKVEQITHDFIFGAHIFNFNQLGTSERNRKYKELFGSLFNSATIAFYWKKFEMEPGKPRFKGEQRDTEAYWNAVTKNGDPKKEPHWRRPASDPVVEFCESKGIRLHGHTLVWGTKKWQHPSWVYEKFCPKEEKAKIKKAGGGEAIRKLKSAQIAEIMPEYIKEMNRLQEKRIVEMAEYYKGRLQSWDVVNESVKDFRDHGNSLSGDAVCVSKYGHVMPGDYIYKAFKTATRAFPKSVQLNINETTTGSNEKYVAQILDLDAKGAGRIDIAGVQYHLFDPKTCLAIADGTDPKTRRPITPLQLREKIDVVAKAGRPIHLSEITVTSPGDDERGRAIQAAIARNLYRLWFSMKPLMGITWWNVVDDCGAPGEPSTSGLFTRDMQPKPSFHVLNQLINHDWKTNLTLKADEKGEVTFRGFKGRYRVTWKDKSGKTQQAEFYLKNDGDGKLDLKS